MRLHLDVLTIEVVFETFTNRLQLRSEWRKFPLVHLLCSSVSFVIKLNAVEMKLNYSHCERREEIAFIQD